LILQASPEGLRLASDKGSVALSGTLPAAAERIVVGDEVFRARLIGIDKTASPGAALVLLDDATPDRLEALARYWRGLRAPPALPDPRLTPQRRERLRQMLRVVDARIERQTYRAIAMVLFPKHEIDAASWAGDAIRETTIRLARDGMKLVRGGYRGLLRRSRKA
jgi:hypothetical protein